MAGLAVSALVPDLWARPVLGWRAYGRLVCDVVLDQTAMLHQTAQRRRGWWGRGQKSVRALRGGAAARTTLETEAHRAAMLCMCIRTSL